MSTPKSVLPEKIKVAIHSLCLEDQKQIFPILLYGIYKKIPEKKMIEFAPSEKGFLQLRLVTGEHLFWIHQNKEESKLIKQILKLFTENKLSHIPERIENCTEALVKNKTIDMQICFLLEHYALNHPFPWRVCADGESLLCANHAVVLCEPGKNNILTTLSILSGHQVSSKDLQGNCVY